MRAGPPVFIVCNARSGSTLLRWLIDAHEEISCPGETDVAALLQAYVDSAQAIGLSIDDALVRARDVVDDLMGLHLARTEGDKTRWCDKSLSNVNVMDRLAEAWPDARFVLLHRHAMDVIASALEASEWGLDSFGLGHYAQMSPTNAVIAVAGYWIERTAAMVDFEARHPGRCLRLRYEDLVTRTDESMEEVWDLFGVDGSQRSNAFAEPHDPLAPADYKIWHTRSVHAESIGRGARIPPDRLGIPVRDSMNQLLAMLGYQQVGIRWGSGGSELAEGATDGNLEIRVIDGHEVLSKVALETFDAGGGGGHRARALLRRGSGARHARRALLAYRELRRRAQAAHGAALRRRAGALRRREAVPRRPGLVPRQLGLGPPGRGGIDGRRQIRVNAM